MRHFESRKTVREVVAGLARVQPNGGQRPNSGEFGYKNTSPRAPLPHGVRCRIGVAVQFDDRLEHADAPLELAIPFAAFVFVEQGKVAGVHLGSLTEARLRKRLE